MQEAKFIKKENDMAEYEVGEVEKETIYDENGNEYKAEKVERK